MIAKKAMTMSSFIGMRSTAAPSAAGAGR
jgi:hypothetical protein